MNNHLEVARYMVQLGGCVYSKVWDGAGGGREEGCLGHQAPGRGAHWLLSSLRKRMAPLVSIMRPKSGTWKWSACC